MTRVKAVQPTAANRDRLWQTLLIVVGVGLVLGVGWLAVVMPQAAILVALAVLAIGVTAVQPGLLPLIALPGLLVVLRVGAGGVDLSVSDFVLAGATLPALFLAKHPFSPGLRAVLWASAAYQFATLVTVVNNPYAANAVEWAHAWTMVSGSLLVGWAVGANGLARTGIRLIVFTIALFAVAAVGEGILQFASGRFDPVYPTIPFPMHKNFTGTVCSLGAVICYVRPSWAGLSAKVSYALMTVMIGAVLVTQSRQGMLGLVAAVFVLVFRGRSERRRSKLVLLLAAPLLVLVTNLVQDQIESGNQFNSVFQRLTWFEDSLHVWSTDPWFGVGLRWWYTDRFAARFQPPNAEIEVLTSAGVLGLIAFLVLLGVAVRAAWQLDAVYGSVAVAVLVNRITQAQFDLYWSAVQGSVPFVILGLCLGAKWFADRHPSGAGRDSTPLAAGSAEVPGRGPRAPRALTPPPTMAAP